MRPLRGSVYEGRLNLPRRGVLRLRMQPAADGQTLRFVVDGFRRDGRQRLEFEARRAAAGGQ